MSRTSQFLYVHTDGDNPDVVGTPVKCSGSLHTVAIHVSNFAGRVYLEGSLASTPADGDWFALVDVMNYPQLEGTGETSTVGITLRGNYLWIRARIEQSHLGGTASGFVDKILLNN